MKNVLLIMLVMNGCVGQVFGGENEQKKVVIFANLKPFNITKCSIKGYVDQWKKFDISAKGNIPYFQSCYEHNPLVNDEINKIVQKKANVYCNFIPLKCCMKTETQYKSKGEELFSFIDKIGDEEVHVVVKLGSRLNSRNPQEDIKKFEDKMHIEANPLLYSYVMVIPGVIGVFAVGILCAWCADFYNKNH